jgi:phosphate transport system protein
MTAHLQKEIDQLKRKFLALSTLVEESLQRAVKAVETRDGKLAQAVIENDVIIDHQEIEVEEDVLKILALHQPVAVDLRFLVALLKTNSDLERIGDLAVNIAERACFLATQPRIAAPFDFATMARKAQAMLTQALNAFVNLDAASARDVLPKDDEVDEINRQMYDLVKAEILKHPDVINCLIHMLSISRHLERVADHATNIAEDVVYMIEGAIVRHNAETFRAPGCEPGAPKA